MFVVLILLLLVGVGVVLVLGFGVIGVKISVEIGVIVFDFWIWFGFGFFLVLNLETGTGFLPKDTAIHHQTWILRLVQDALKESKLVPSQVFGNESPLFKMRKKKEDGIGKNRNHIITSSSHKKF
jgi:hypothetical protein